MIAEAGYGRLLIVTEILDLLYSYLTKTVTNFQNRIKILFCRLITYKRLKDYQLIPNEVCSKQGM
jgi:hypothetical protein